MKNSVSMFGSLAAAAFLIQCYSPQPQQLSNGATADVSIESGTVYAVNGSHQICNPSIAPGGVHSGCMLWLNFGGDLNVNVPKGLEGYATDRVNVRQHDRLTVSDTANAVRWFIMRDELDVTGQLQDPEWSTRADYIICLGDEHNDNRWGAYAVRLSDKSHCKVSDGNMIETSTPHLWIAPSAVPGTDAVAPSYSDTRGGFADQAAIRAFFGTDSVRIVYAAKNSGLALRYMDFSANDAKPVELRKPEGRNDWDVESPLFSPDGRWIAYNCIGQGVYESYLQRLDGDAPPILLANNAADPHWWVHPEFGTVNIVYASINNGYFVKEDYTDPELADGTIGATWKQEIRIASGSVPNHAAYAAVGEPSLIVNLPFKGGISPDGRYLCTGYGYGFIISLF